MHSGEFLPLACFFDRLDVRLRRLGRWIKERWVVLPAVAKFLVVLMCAAAPVYGTYYLISGG